MIHDATGTVTVSGDDISFIDLPESPHSYESNGKRYQLFLLLENMKVLLIGKATNQNQQISIQKDDGKQVFGLSPVDRVQRWNLYRPFRQSLLRHFLVLTVLIITILVCEFRVENDEIFVSVPSLYEPIDLAENIKQYYKSIFQ